jgi:hypothetical protein
VAAAQGSFTSVSVTEAKVLLERGDSVYRFPDGRFPSIDRTFTPERKLRELLALIESINDGTVKPPPLPPQPKKPKTAAKKKMNIPAKNPAHWR